MTRAGPALIVQSIAPQNHPEGVLVYNFEVGDDHAYFLGTANGGLWVHNDEACIQTVRQAEAAIARGVNNVAIASREDAEIFSFR